MNVHIHPYIVLNGNAKEAVDFYSKALGAEVIGIQTFGDMPDNPEYPTPPEMKERVLHASLQLGNARLMFSDTMPGQPHEIGNNVTIAITLSDVEKSKVIFEKLSEEGNVTMALQETFWSPSYGQVTDKFGVQWQVSVEGQQ
ncbi:MAG: VOC family protein [Bacillaceae bacterium]|nr:VOC family protein [Bacillaceae bacterium]